MLNKEEVYSNCIVPLTLLIWAPGGSCLTFYFNKEKRNTVNLGIKLRREKEKRCYFLFIECSFAFLPL